MDALDADPIKRVDLNWETCYRIVGGIARGILYLHEDSRHRVIDRDLKASNILLDADMNPKISDFGMARLFVVDQTQENTSRIAGTFGYMAPEYAMHGRFSVKSDVYSFGVLLLEILTGLRNNSFDHLQERGNLLSYAWRHWKEGKALQLICPTLRASASVREAIRCIQIALLCVQEDALDRPTMGSVVAMLTSFSVSLALPSRPSFFVNFETTVTNRSHFAESEKLI
ncbi:hypothetical protein Syun_027056 [Stephania yunnanensis]|uniref:Protein kinase domain-containing protein n=1 Tax=Stephania yunnanensis TaxID=152371 RepID=A0AAP0HQY3_9MAGN